MNAENEPVTMHNFLPLTGSGIGAALRSVYSCPAKNLPHGFDVLLAHIDENTLGEECPVIHPDDQE